MSQTHISQLREHLMSTLGDLRNRDTPMEPDRARAIAQVAGVLVDTAKVEVDYLRATGQEHSAFMAHPNGQRLQLPAEPATPFTGLVGRTVHRLEG